MCRGQLAIDQLDAQRRAALDQAGQCGLGRVALAAEHRLAEEYASEQHAVHATDQPVGAINLIAVRQPALVQLRHDRPQALRILGENPGADRIMNESIFIGVYPGLTRPMLDFIIETISGFARKS